MYIGRGNGGKTHLLNCSYPGRGWLGNPFIRKFRDETPIPREESIAMYRVAFAKSVNESAYFRHQIREACTDKKLVCYCAPLSCHGDVIAEFVNAGCPENWK